MHLVAHSADSQMRSLCRKTRSQALGGRGTSLRRHASAASDTRTDSVSRPAPTAESQILDAATVPFYLEGTNHKAGDAVFDQTFATNDSLDDFLSKNENWFIRPAEFHDEQSNPMGANSSFRAMVGSSGGPCGCRSSPMTPGAAQPTHGIVMPDSRMETIPLACGGLGQADPQNPAPPLTPPRGRRQVPAPPLVVRQQRLQTAHQQPVAPQQGSLPTNTNAAQVPGNKVGQTPGYPQALRLHKRFCKPADSCEVADGCKADCPLLIEFPEKHAEMSNTKSRKKACEGKLRLWESHELMYGSDQ